MTVHTTVAHTSGRLFGACLLIAGTAIGAAMLALPVSTGRAGLLLSLLVMVGVWLYLLYAACCLLEVSLSMPKGANLVTMAEETLGKTGKYTTWTAFLFLLYALNTAYLFGMTAIVHALTGVDKGLCAGALVALFYAIFRKGMSYIDSINRLFMAGFALTFVLLVTCAAPYVTGAIVVKANWHYALSSLGIILCAFGYHIVIPSLVSYLDRDVRQIKKAICIGSAIPLLIYALWQIVSLGVVSDTQVMCEAYSAGLNSAQLIAKVSGSAFIARLDTSFACFAMITSFFGVSAALLDFLRDGLSGKIVAGKRLQALIFAVGFIPPLFFSLKDERVFLLALEYAGAYGVVILLALLPACMVWSKRYVQKRASNYEVTGKKPLLIFFMAISLSLILIQLLVKAAP